MFAVSQSEQSGSTQLHVLSLWRIKFI